MKARVEILAPAGSVASLKAAVLAGADAVYMGGSRFGARAYAENAGEEEFLSGLDYAHLHGCRVYMTVNTLVKESELDQLYDYLKPYYEHGLDAVIVQDMGVFSFIREYFPDLPIHASTQMTVTGYRSAKLLEELGATRVVTARELSLDEIRRIHQKTKLEIESFVHGALCYCYSGQCLLSSLIGGRSGNRGRCAQPCRLPYEVAGRAGSGGETGRQGSPKRGADRCEAVGRSADRTGGKKDRYLLSLKDLCTLDILPDIIEAGVYSLKIEGRMKSPRYTAGVVSVYRKYVDRYLEKGRSGYRVDPADKKLLLDLFDRGGLTEGYYRQHNGRDMVALKEKPAFRETSQELFDRLDAAYVNAVKQEPLTGMVHAKVGEPVRLTLSMDQEGEELWVTVSGAEVQAAQKQPMTEEKLLKQMNKTGGTPFFFESLTAEISGEGFLPVQALNELRRQGLEAMRERILQKYQRSAKQSREMEENKQKALCVSAVNASTGAAVSEDRNGQMTLLYVSLEEPEGLSVVTEHPEVDGVYLDAVGFAAESWKQSVEACHRAEKRCALILPQIFRTEAEQYFRQHKEELLGAGFDELILRSMEEAAFLQELGLGRIPLVFDANLYVMNHISAAFMERTGASRLTLPLELNSRELGQLVRGAQMADGWEMIVYGYLPAMVSAQCITRTTEGCSRTPGLLKLKDRTGKLLPVKNHCRFCYNTIYNPDPLSLLGCEKDVKALHPSVLRLSFTFEKPEQIGRVLDVYADHFRYGKDTPAPLSDFTRGHFRRGVE